MKAACPGCEPALYCHYSRAPGFLCSVVATARYNYVWFGSLLMGIQILRLAEFTISVPVLIRFITGWCGTFLSLKNSEALLTGWFLILSVWCSQMQWLHYFHPCNREQTGLFTTPPVHFQPKPALVFHRRPPARTGSIIQAHIWKFSTQQQSFVFAL